MEIEPVAVEVKVTDEKLIVEIFVSRAAKQ